MGTFSVKLLLANRKLGPSSPPHLLLQTQTAQDLPPSLGSRRRNVLAFFFNLTTSLLIKYNSTNKKKHL